MYTIIPLLLAHIQELNKQISFLFKFIVKNIPLNLEKSKDNSLYSPKYNKLKVDSLPIIKVHEKKDYKLLLQQYLKEHGKPLKPIKSRGKNPVPDNVHCPCCNAPCKSLTNTKVLTKENISPLELLKKISGKDFNLCPVCGKRTFNKTWSNIIIYNFIPS